MDISYCNHHCNKEAILVYNNMAFDAFHFFIAVNSVKRPVIALFNALAIYYTYTGFHFLIPLYPDMTT
jgi:hypothetical protein